jgi:hypothetical protein
MPGQLPFHWKPIWLSKCVWFNVGILSGSVQWRNISHIPWERNSSSRVNKSYVNTIGSELICKSSVRFPSLRGNENCTEQLSSMLLAKVATVRR